MKYHLQASRKLLVFLLLLSSIAMAQTTSIYPSTYSTAKNPGFNTSSYESWTYLRIKEGAYQHLPFRMLKPKGYVKNGTSYPLVIMLHGRGEAGTDNNYQLLWGGKKHQDAVESGKWPGFVVFPQEPWGYWGDVNFNPNQASTSLSQVWDLVDSLVTKYNVDPNRVFIHGLSAGGTAVWASLYNRPELFAGALPMSAPGDYSQATKVSTTPIWLFQGGKDINPIPDISRTMISKIRAEGALDETSTKYSEYPDLEHYTWDRAYDEPDFFPYMLRQNRKNITILGKNPIPAGKTVGLGVVAGMSLYQWFKDGALIAGATSNRLEGITASGVYSSKFKRFISDTQWISSNNVTISSGTNNQNILPVTSLLSPANNSSVTAPATINFVASASDADGTIVKVEFFNGGILIGSSVTAPYTFNWTNVPVGTYSITSVATDNLGGTNISIPVTVNVTSVQNLAPTVGISSPVSGTAFNAPANITITANAADQDGTVSKVEFYNGVTLLGTATTSPYQFTWGNVSAGSYSITAKATDNGGIATVSAAVSVQVNSLQNQSPLVSLTAPLNNATFNAPATFTLQANASDPDGTVAKVEFYNGAILVGTSTQPPYQFTISGIAAGNYNFTAQATDNKGSVTVSTAVAVSVKTVSNQNPILSLTSPAANASFTAPASIAIAASASDPDGTVVKVEFYNGATLLGTDNSSPYQFTWSGVTAGTYTIAAKATDNAGGIFSQSVQVTVTGGVVTGPFITSAECFSARQTVTFELPAANIKNATNYNWWYTGSGVSLTVNSTQRYKASAITGTAVAGGDVCVGVSYSGSPYYAQFCKTMKVCSGVQGREEEVADAAIRADVTTGQYLFQSTKNIYSLQVINTSGVVVATRNNLSANETLHLENMVSSGIYLLQIRFEDGTSDVKRLLLTK